MGQHKQCLMDIRSIQFLKDRLLNYSYFLILHNCKQLLKSRVFTKFIYKLSHHKKVHLSLPRLLMYSDQPFQDILLQNQLIQNFQLKQVPYSKSRCTILQRLIQLEKKLNLVGIIHNTSTDFLRNFLGYYQEYLGNFLPNLWGYFHILNHKPLIAYLKPLAKEKLNLKQLIIFFHYAGLLISI